MKYLILVAFIISNLFFALPVVAASADHVVISQIQIDSIAGGGGLEDDFVELFNPTDQDIDLEGWSIQKTSATGGSLNRKGLTGTVPAHSYFLIVRNNVETDPSLIAKADVLAAGTGFSLSNDNTIYLVSNNEDITGSDDLDIVDLVGFGQAENFEGQPVLNPEDAASIERLPGGLLGNGDDTDNNLADFFMQPAPHPRNSQSSPIDSGESESDDPVPDPDESSDESEEPPVNATSTAILISEVLPNPEGDDLEGEFIELFNPSDANIDLTDWMIDDNSKSVALASTEDFEPTVPALGFLVLSRGVTAISLNNSGEERVQLLDPSGGLVDEVVFDASKHEAESYARTDKNAFQWTSIPTPGAVNEFSEEGSPPSQQENEQPADEPQDEQEDESNQDQNSNNLSQARDRLEERINQVKQRIVQIREVLLQRIRSITLGSVIRTSGLVVVEPGVLGENIIYLQGGDGVRVAFAALPEQALESGMMISLAGEVDTFHNELQLKVSDSESLEILSEKNIVPPERINSQKVGEEREGRLVTLSGVVSKNSGNSFSLNDGFGDARILLQESTGIIKPVIKKGDQVSVIGLVSQFNSAYRILPRYQSDIILAQISGDNFVNNLPRTGQNFWLVLAILVALFVFLNILLAKIREKNLRIKY